MKLLFEIRDQFFTFFKRWINVRKTAIWKIFDLCKFDFNRSTFSGFLWGLSVKKFNMLFDIVSPYTDTIIYPDCISVMGEKTLGSQQNCWIILQYIDIRYILVLYILYWTLEKALFVGSLLDGQYLKKLYSAD